MKKLVLFCALFVFTSLKAQLIEVETSAEFKNLVAESQVPVIVQFSAYWCGPCQELKAKLKKVALNYDDSQALIVYVDAYVNSDLRRYLQGGYPTVRTFTDGKLMSPSFAGNKPESYVKSFIDNVISRPDC